MYGDFVLKEAVKIMAKDLVRTRNFIKKFYLMKANLQAVSLKIQVSPTPIAPPTSDVFTADTTITSSHGSGFKRSIKSE